MSGVRIVWAITWRLLVTAAVAFCVFAITPPGENPGKVLRITDADVQVEVERDGALVVRERLDYDFTGSFRGAYRDIPLAKGAQSTAVVVAENGERYEPGGNTTLGSTDTPGRYGVERLTYVDSEGQPQEGLRIVWHYRAQDETRQWEIAYRVRGAVTAYDDVIDVGWVVWGDQWEFWLDDLEAAITLPGSEPIEAWVRPASLGAPAEIDGDSAETSVERAPQGDAVILRAVYPRDALAGTSAARIAGGDGLEQIRAEEDARGDVSILTRARNAVVDALGPVTIAWTVLILALTAMLFVGGRERRVDVPEHLPEPPEDIPPALAYALATEGRYNKRVVVATLLDLIDRGYYEADATAGTDLDLEIEIAAERPSTQGLEPYEQSALGFFDELLGGKRVAFSKLKDEVPEHSSRWRGRWEKLNGKLDQAEEGHLSWDRDNTGRRSSLALIALAGFALLVFAEWSRNGQLGLPFVAAVFTLLMMYVLPSEWLKRLDEGARERNARWAAFMRWTDDFPSLHDDPPATLKLWRSILVYAVAFGTAERIARSGRIPDPVVADANTGWAYAAIHHPGVASNFDGFSSSFSSQVAPESSSGGGGGFSGGGGGGGFSGGGGGGGW